MAKSYNSLIEYFISKSVKNRDAKHVGLHSQSCCLCGKSVPRPCLLASQIILVSLLSFQMRQFDNSFDPIVISIKRYFRVRLLISNPHLFLKILLNGKLIAAESGINSLN